MTDTLFDKLSMPATPDRPFEDDGTVLQASDTPLLPMQVWSRCEDLVASHLERGEDLRGAVERLGSPRRA